MQHKCAQHKWDHFLFLRNYQTNVLDLRKKKLHMMKHISSKPTEKEEKRKAFSHYLVSVKNRNSPVTFTLHFLIIYSYVHGFLLIICHCP